MSLADELRPYVEELKADKAAGNQKAKQVISLYQMHVACPQDPVAPALCKTAFEDWKKAKEPTA